MEKRMMKVIMLEHYQDAQSHFAAQQIIEVSNELGAWFLEHRKAVKIEETKEPAQEVEPEKPEPQRLETPKRAGGKHANRNS
jgi:hypothetical protein